ncbi:MAG: IS4 family transposase [Bryobacteraceae bacterium]|nr:IS4 family transposase [Bryobacteraceae bacterium]
MPEKRLGAARAGSKLGLPGKLLSLDATVIDLCASVCDWARFRTTKGAVKLHLLLDHDGYLPCYAVITEGKVHEIQVARRLQLQRGAMLVFDRGYTDYEWFQQLTEQGVHFVTRLKDNAAYIVVERRAADAKGVRGDEIIVLDKQADSDTAPFLRRVRYWDEGSQRELVFLTNHLELPAATVAAGVQGAMADRTAVQSAQAEPPYQDLRGYDRQCPEDTNLDSIDRAAGGEVPATAVRLRLEPVPADCAIETAAVRL